LLSVDHPEGCSWQRDNDAVILYLDAEPDGFSHPFYSSLLGTRTLLVMPSSRCKQCDQPLVEIDNYGERLIGCIECNCWTWRGSKQPIELPQDDLEALRAAAGRKQCRSTDITKFKSCALSSSVMRVILYGGIIS